MLFVMSGWRSKPKGGGSRVPPSELFWGRDEQKNEFEPGGWGRRRDDGWVVFGESVEMKIISS